MSFKLTRVEAGTWAGKTGDEFEVDVAPAAPAGGPFLIHSICYGSIFLHEPPFKFQVAAGSKGLSAVYDWDQEGQWVDLIEMAGPETQVLRKKRYKESEPFQGVLIKGE
jgi:hypothetical protein